MHRRTINPWTWQDQFGYAQAVEITAGQHVLYCAGQAAMNAAGQPQHAGDMGAQLALAMDNLDTVLHAGRYTLGDVVRLTVYTTDVDTCLAHYAPVVSRLAAAGSHPPATLVGVTRLAFPDLLVEIEATAVR